MAADLLWLNHLTSCTGCAGLAPFVGGNFDSLVFSPAVVVYGAEIIRQARAFAAGLALEEELVGFDEIAATGPGGNFLGTDLTLRRFRESATGSRLWPRLSLERWREAGAPRADVLLRQRTVELLALLRPPADHEEVTQRGKELVNKKTAKS